MSQETINKTMQKQINRECMIKKVVKEAQLNSEQRKALARRKIEQYKENKQLEEYIFDYE